MDSNDFTLTKEYLHQLFEYKNGELFRKTSPSPNSKIGSRAGSGKRYEKTKIKDVCYSNHRLIFLMHHGYLPECIDHINGNKLDNRIENLRAATWQENSLNRKLPLNNKSGVKGVCWIKNMNKWQAYCSVNYKLIKLGYFDSLEDAKICVEKFRKENHGKFSNNG